MTATPQRRSMSTLPVLVLCGGLGTRLRAAVADRPKVLAPVDGVPFLDYLLAHLARQGFTDVVLATGYLGEMVEDHAGDGSRHGVRARYAREPKPLGTGGAITWDSAAGHEHAEAMSKAGFLTVPPDFALIETMRLDAGVVVRLDRHLAGDGAEADEDEGAPLVTRHSGGAAWDWRRVLGLRRRSNNGRDRCVSGKQ